MRNVFITGMGAVSSLGANVKTMFDSLVEHKSGIQKMPDWYQYRGLQAQIAAPVGNYDIMKLPRSSRRTMSRMSEMAALATLEALESAQIPIGLDHSRSNLMIGSSTGSPIVYEEYFRKMFQNQGPEGQLGTSFFKIMNHSVASNVASAIEFKGPALSPASACATSAQNIALGWELIQSGLYDIVIAGGADELHYTAAAVFDVVFAASRAYNERPFQASRPFDRDRDGLVVSEGAGVVILEAEDSVLRRHARPLAKVDAGAYLCSGAHMSQSDARVMADVMQMALARARIKPEEINYINAHATGTKQGDQEEALGISTVFGNRVPVSSLKGHMGHSLAACGALEAIASICMMANDLLIPTRNLDNVDDGCREIHHLRSRQTAKISRVLSNNFAFGGINTCLILSQCHA